jgi:hypothetical protein
MSIELTILKFLRAAGDLLTPETQIRDDVRLTVAPAPTGLEVSEALNRIEGEGWAVSIRDSVTKIVRWQITDLGRVQLTKRGL